MICSRRKFQSLFTDRQVYIIAFPEIFLFQSRQSQFHLEDIGHEESSTVLNSLPRHYHHSCVKTYVVFRKISLFCIHKDQDYNVRN